MGARAARAKAFRRPEPRRRAILVGGGVGIAPLAILQDALEAEAATDVTVLLGFRDGARAQGAALLHGARVATDDGSVGHHGLLTELLSQELYADSRAEVYACGPAPMLEAVRAMCASAAVPAQLALEAGMACGFGACYGCAVPRRGGGYLRVCVDGPVIDAAELERVSEHGGAPREPQASHGRRRARSVEFCGLPLAHPVINGSGTFDAIAARARSARRWSATSRSPPSSPRRSRCARARATRRRACGRRPAG